MNPVQHALKLRKLGDFPVSADLIRTSHLYQDLRGLGFPEELAMAFGLHDLQVATAINRYARAFGTALDVQLANLRLELHRQWQKDQASQDDDELVLGAALAGSNLQTPMALPLRIPPFAFPTSQQSPNAPNGIDMGFSLTIADGVTLKPGDAVGSKMVGGKQFAVPATLDNFLGLARIINGPTVNIALPGEEVGAFVSQNPGDLLAITSNSSSPVPVSQVASNTSYKVVGRVFAMGRTEVLDWPPTIAASATPPLASLFVYKIKAGVTITSGQTVGLEDDGSGNPVAVLATTDNFVGLAGTVANGSVTVTPPGLLAQGLSGLKFGAVYGIRNDTPGSFVLIPGGLPNGIVVKVILRALAATAGTVLDWIPVQIGDPNGPF